MSNLHKTHNNSSSSVVPEWSFQLTEKLLSSPSSTSVHNATTSKNNNPYFAATADPNRPMTGAGSSAIIVHPPNDKHKQFTNYLDREFTRDDAAVLKKRLSETPSKATTLGNDSNIVLIPNHPSYNRNMSREESTSAAGRHQEKTSAAIDNIDQEEGNVWWVSKNDQDGFYSICGFFFLFGFIFPPLWWLGSFYPRHVKEKGGKMADRWQKLNRIMSLLFSTILIILIIVFAILYSKGSM